MQGVLEGFGVAAVVIALGAVLAHVGVLGPDSQDMLTRLVFYVASPALLFTLLLRIDVATLLSVTVVVTGLSVAVCALAYAAVAYARWPPGPPLLIGVLCTSYVNAGNLGLPIAIYALGDASAVVSAILLQMLVLTPLTVGYLDHHASGRPASLNALVSLPLRNPVTVAAILGVCVELSGWRPPSIVTAPVQLLSGMAVPCMLLAYGASLRLGPRLDSTRPSAQLAFIVGLKLVVQPIAAYALGRFAFGLGGTDLLGVTVVAALPTGQNVFLFASRYRCAIDLARDAILATSVCSVPVIVGIAAVLS